MALNSCSLRTRCEASIRRTVPLRERITRLWVWAPRALNRTPRSRWPSVTPVAAKKQLSPWTRSSCVSTRSRSMPAAPSAARPHFVDQAAVAGPIEYHHRQVAHALLLGLGDPAQVLRDAGGDVDGAD